MSKFKVKSDTRYFDTVTTTSHLYKDVLSSPKTVVVLHNTIDYLYLVDKLLANNKSFEVILMSREEGKLYHRRLPINDKNSKAYKYLIGSKTALNPEKVFKLDDFTTYRLGIYVNKAFKRHIQYKKFKMFITKLIKKYKQNNH